MAMLSFPEWRPDANDINDAHTQSIMNVVPQSDGYGPFKEWEAISASLPGTPRGGFYARKGDKTIAIFGATSTGLYLLDNLTLTWKDVSQGVYSGIDAGANWSFTQFNSKVIAVQANVNPQVFDVDTPSATFTDLPGAPPQAAHVTTVNRFVVLSGLRAFPKRIQWSGLNNINVWTSGTNYSDYQDFPDGGNVSIVVGGEFGLVMQDASVRRMTYVPGSDVIFEIVRVSKDFGTEAPWSVIEASGLIFFYSNRGFVKMTTDGSITPIGVERVNRTFLKTYDATAPELFTGASDPTESLVFWTYREHGQPSTSPSSKMLAFNFALDRWSTISISVQGIVTLSRPGLSIDNMGAIGSDPITNAFDNGAGLIRIEIADTSRFTSGNTYDISNFTAGTTEANGAWIVTVVDSTHLDLQGSVFTNAYTAVGAGYVDGSIDAIAWSLDDISLATLPRFAAYSTTGEIGYFTGKNVEAFVETGEQTGIMTRTFVSGVMPITDASECWASIAGREAPNAAPVYTAETRINKQGFCPQRKSTRLARIKVRIPKGAVWRYIKGVEPLFQQDGAR